MVNMCFGKDEQLMRERKLCDVVLQSIDKPWLRYIVIKNNQTKSAQVNP